MTVDALMTQTEIGKTVIEQKGDYMMALKGNQGCLYEDVQLYFSPIQAGMSCARSIEKNRGHVETRTRTIASADWVENKESWVGLKNVCKIDSEIYC